MSDPTRQSPTPADSSTSVQQRQLLKTINVMALIIGIVICTGIFGVPALVAANSFSVTEMLIAWTLGGLISIAGALVYAELTTSYLSAGVDYHFLRQAYGDKVAFLFAWAQLTVIPAGSIALMSYIFGEYATQLYSLGPYSSAIYAAGMVLVVINMAGLRSSKWTQNFLTLIEVGGVVLIILAGLFLTPDPAAATTTSDTAPRRATHWGLILVFVMLDLWQMERSGLRLGRDRRPQSQPAALVVLQFVYRHDRLPVE